MKADVFMDGKWLTTLDSMEPLLDKSEIPFDFDRVFTVKTDFPAEVLTKLAKPGYELEFGGGARGTTEGVDEDGIIVRMLNSEFQKLRISEAK